MTKLKIHLQASADNNAICEFPLKKDPLLTYYVCVSEPQSLGDSKPERLDHQVALIAQSVDHRSTKSRVWGSIPTQVNKIFQSFHECVG